MNFSTILGLSRTDILHVPEHIRIDRLTTTSAVRKLRIHGRKKSYVQYAVWEDSVLLFMGTADEVGAELGIEKSMVVNYSCRGQKVEGRMGIFRVEE